LAQDNNSYWKRVYRLVFPDINLEFNNTDAPKEEAVKIAFDIDRDLSQETNKLKLKLWNLKDESRAKIEKEDLKLELYAGYAENGGAKKMFVGSVIRAVSVDEGQDVTTELQASDGQVAVRDTILSLSYAPGTSSQIIVKAISDGMGLPLVVGEGVEFVAYDNGYSFVGKGADALDEICKGQGLDWSIQNSVLQVILAGGNAKKTGIVYSPATGLIGSPARIVKARPKEDQNTPKRKAKQSKKKEKPGKKAGWKIETLLSPTVNPGDAVKVESRIIKGWFRVESIKHNGEIYGGEFKTQMELVEGLEQ